jgi:hypothetical protein
MLADGEDEGVVESDVGALRLGDVEIVSLCVRRRMQGQKVVRRVGACVGYRKAESQ